MSKKLADLRFGIKNSLGYVSNIWRLWVTSHGDVYLATRSMAGIEKYSFHKSGICRSAFTKEYGTPKSLTDRVIFKWQRLATPPTGQGKAARVALIAFPTDYLSKNGDPSLEVNWIEAAPPGGATYLDLAFTCESRDSVETSFSQRQERKCLLYVNLPGEEAVLLDYYHSDWENEDLKIPGNGIVSDLLFSANDPYETGRPIRIRFGPRPSNGDAMLLRELGGYAVPGTPNPTHQVTHARERP
jgi:hypothetical protein